MKVCSIVHILLLVFLLMSCSNQKEEQASHNFTQKSNAEYSERLEQLYFEDQLVRRVVSLTKRNCKDSNDKPSVRKIESILYNEYIAPYDSLRTEEFLRLIELYDYPDDAINYKNIGFHVILMHSPASLFGKSQKVLSQSSIPEAELEAIKWHWGGRTENLPFVYNKRYFTDGEVLAYFDK